MAIKYSIMISTLSIISNILIIPFDQVFVCFLINTFFLDLVSLFTLKKKLFKWH